MATAMRNGSTDAQIAAATPRPTGAMRITAVALFIQSDRSIVMTRTTATRLHGGSESPRSVTIEAMRSAPPVVSRAGFAHRDHRAQEDDGPVDRLIGSLKREEAADEQYGDRARQRYVDLDDAEYGQQEGGGKKAMGTSRGRRCPTPNSR